MHARRGLPKAFPLSQHGVMLWHQPTAGLFGRQSRRQTPETECDCEALLVGACPPVHRQCNHTQLESAERTRACSVSLRCECWGLLHRAAPDGRALAIEVVLAVNRTRMLRSHTLQTRATGVVRTFVGLRVSVCERRESFAVHVAKRRTPRGDEWVGRHWNCRMSM